MHSFGTHHVVQNNDHEEPNSGMPPDFIDMPPQEPEAATSYDAGGRDGRQINGEESHWDAFSEGSLDYGGRMHHDDDEWENVEDETDSVQGDEGLDPHQMEVSGFNRRWMDFSGYAISRLMRNLNSPMATHENLSPEDFWHDTASPIDSGTLTPNSMYPEPPSSGEHSLESSEHSLHRTNSQTVLSFMEPPTYFQPTPSNYFIDASMWLTLDPTLGAPFTVDIDMDLAENRSNNDDN